MPNEINKKIEQAKQQLEQMIDLNPQIMMLVDSNLTIARANKALLDMVSIESGYTEVLGTALSEVFNCPNDKFFNELLAGDSGYEGMTSETVLPDGRTHILKFTVVGAGSSSELFALIVEDVTDESEIATTLKKEHKKEAVHELTGALLHNINQPLTIILMRAQLMQLQLEQGDVAHDELSNSLNDIVSFTINIANSIKQIEDAKDYITQSYSKGVNILDIKKSTGLKDVSNVIDAFMISLDAHLPGYWLHSKRTSKYAELIAENMDLDAQQVECVGRCAMLHDIGKLGVEDKLLSKPKQLTDTEMEAMKKHSENGNTMLSNFPSLKDEAEAALYHHEKFDGSGYPHGISSSGIPLSARIIALADTYDALRFSRVYKQELSHDKVVAEILDGKGSYYDPEVVDAFMNCSDELDTLFSHD